MGLVGTLEPPQVQEHGKHQTSPQALPHLIPDQTPVVVTGILALLTYEVLPTNIEVLLISLSILLQQS